MTLSTFAQLETSSNMKKRFTLKRSRTKDRDEDLQEISLDILLAHKDDVICKVLYNQFAFSITTLFEFQIFCFYVNVLFQLKNEYKSFLSRKLDIEKELAEVEKHEIFLRWYWNRAFIHSIYHKIGNKILTTRNLNWTESTK